LRPMSIHQKDLWSIQKSIRSLYSLYHNFPNFRHLIGEILEILGKNLL
jgi:hypothetical protein